MKDNGDKAAGRYGQIERSLVYDDLRHLCPFPSVLETYQIHIAL
jgi:hypothetical protein